jgi:hypothetical protein
MSSDPPGAVPRAAALPLSVRQPSAVRRRRWWWVAAAVLFMIVSVVIYDYARTKRASAERALAAANLQAIATGFRVYRDAEGEWPTLAALLRTGALVSEQTKQFISVRDDRADGPRVLVAQKHAARAIRKGERYGDPDQRATADMPAVRYLLFENLEVRAVREDDFQRDIVPHLHEAPR